MRCCVNCFNSRYLKSVIESFSTGKGTCDFCQSSDTDLCDPRELQNYFRNLVELYISVTDIKSLGFSIENKSQNLDSISNRLLLDFPGLIFSSVVASQVPVLLDSIFEGNNDYVILFIEPVGLEHLFNDANYQDYHRLSTTWLSFVDEIKNKNRFHISTQVNLRTIERILENHIKVYGPGKIFYRGRISNSKGFPIAEMGNPPAHLAKAGRANPAGISYLYVAESVDTTLYETRAGLYDYVSIGEFTVQQPIKVINLREPHLYDPIQLADSDKIKAFMLNLPFLSILEKELSKPLRRSDNELDYLPTQYLSEFIKSLGYDGIEYRSSLNSSGFNVAVFNPEKLVCTKAYIHEIHEVAFGHSKFLNP